MVARLDLTGRIDPKRPLATPTQKMGDGKKISGSSEASSVTLQLFTARKSSFNIHEIDAG